MKILYVVGARPNFVKMAPVLSAVRKRLPTAEHVLVNTGQHYDRAMADVFLEELGIPQPDHVLAVGSGTHAIQTARAMERLEPVLLAERPDLTIVPGDVNSTLAATLVAAKLGLRLAHLEAGLRSFDRTMPEEVNRIVADQFADLLFIHSPEAATNLAREGIPADRVHFVGNTMIDSLVTMEHRFRQLGVCRSFGCEPGSYLLVTLHRPALVDTHQLFAVLDELTKLARAMPIIFPAHPRTRKMLAGQILSPAIQMIDPIGYLDFLSLEADAAAVLTDSGGVQEETTYLGVPCFTLRDNTERPITVTHGTNTLLGLNPDRIREIPEALTRGHHSTALLSGWDGAAADRVADVIERTLNV